MFPIQITSNLEKLTATIGRYIALSGKSVAEVIDRKARSLGIRLFGAFREHQWGGAPKRKGIARAELDARSAQKRGIVVRESIVQEMDAQRINNATLRANIRAKRQGGPATKAQDKQLKSLLRARANLWRRAVGQELKARDRGIGVLAASFLWVRRSQRFSKSQDKYVASGSTEFVRNRRGGILGFLESSDGLARIVAETPGVSRVGERYGIVPAAIAAETADTEAFIRRRFLGIFEEATVSGG